MNGGQPVPKITITMFCPHCGTKNDTGAAFCSNCGQKFAADTHAAHHAEAVTHDVFYNEEWEKKGFVIAGVPYFDILIDKKNLYLIKLPISYAPTWGFLIGLLGNLIGIIIGLIVGQTIARKKRERARAVWFEGGKIISNEFEKYTFLKIPLGELKNHLTFKKGKYLVFTYNEGELTIKKGAKSFRGESSKSFVAVSNQVKKYVL